MFSENKIVALRSPLPYAAPSGALAARALIENRCGSEKMYEHQWKSMEIRDNLWKSMKPSAKHLKPMKIYGNQK